ncbi:MAG: shikimate kinase [Patescibacteria group bacterium]
MRGITLIGMPGAGKSTIGKMLAEKLKFGFIDLDDVIQEKEGRSAGVILRERGGDELIRLEESFALSLDFNNAVFAPGGSIIYSSQVMSKLKFETLIIYLKLSLAEIKKRLGGEDENRGIVRLAELGWPALFEERAALYDRWADNTVDCDGLGLDDLLEKICKIYCH